MEQLPQSVEEFKQENAQGYGDEHHTSGVVDGHWDRAELPIDSQEAERLWNKAVLEGDGQSANYWEQFRK